MGLQNGARSSRETQLPTAAGAQGKGGGGGSSRRRWWDRTRTSGTRQRQLMGPRGSRPCPLQRDVWPQLEKEQCYTKSASLVLNLTYALFGLLNSDHA